MGLALLPKIQFQETGLGNEVATTEGTSTSPRSRERKRNAQSSVIFLIDLIHLTSFHFVKILPCLDRQNFELFLGSLKTDEISGDDLVKIDCHVSSVTLHNFKKLVEIYKRLTCSQ